MAVAVAAYAVTTQTATRTGTDFLFRNLQIFTFTSALFPAVSLAIRVTEMMMMNGSSKAERRAVYKDGFLTFAFTIPTVIGLELTQHSVADVLTQNSECALRAAHLSGFIMAAAHAIDAAVQTYYGLDETDVRKKNYYLKEGLKALALSGICVAFALGASTLRS